MAARMDLGVDDLTKTALKRLVTQLLSASEGEEKRILDQLATQEKSDKERNDLADLVEEKRGKPASISAEDDDFEDEAKAETKQALSDELKRRKRGMA